MKEREEGEGRRERGGSRRGKEEGGREEGWRRGEGGREGHHCLSIVVAGSFSFEV